MVSRSKRAQVELSLEQIIGLVIAVVIVIASIAFFTGLMNIFMGPPESGSLATLQFAMETANAFYNKDNHNTSCVLKASYLGAQDSLVGFNADNVVSARKKITCEIGKGCIEESCGARYQDINKPTSCGKGPCLCICKGGAKYGDVDGDDCINNGVCQKLSSGMSLKMFYMDDDAENKCPGKFNYPGLCDLVLDGKTCGGTRRNVQYSIAIKKASEDALIFDLISTDDIKNYYANAVDCKTMVDDMKRLVRQAQAPATQAKTNQPETLKSSMGNIGQNIQGYAIQEN